MKYFIFTLDPNAKETALWWKPGRRGYTLNLEEAGLYEEKEAREIERLRPPEDRAIPEDVARRLARSRVPLDDLQGELNCEVRVAAR